MSKLDEQVAGEVAQGWLRKRGRPLDWNGEDYITPTELYQIVLFALDRKAMLEDEADLSRNPGRS